ncbi:unnamed protein product [Adineta ricciae]|uniref:Uncharacterized protein n=1 Tax=Adineta ricciae TaxID=249248 RepID=A0A815RCQ2_ADIRI|nr:unnamed protein product [Adineta ricciae]CAF1474782.1 unnamed protein product [Adineta ricciae]
MATNRITDAKLEGLFWVYTHNGVARRSSNGEYGAHDLAYGNSPKPYVDVVLSGGLGEYKVKAVIDANDLGDGQLVGGPKQANNACFLKLCACCIPQGVDEVPPSVLTQNKKLQC